MVGSVHDSMQKLNGSTAETTTCRVSYACSWFGLHTSIDPTSGSLSKVENDEQG